MSRSLAAGPPARPPHALLFDSASGEVVRGRLVYEDWGDARRVGRASFPPAATLPPRVDGGRAVVTLLTRRLPARLDVRVFRTGSRGQPTGPGARLDCLARGSRCTVARGRGRVAITLPAGVARRAGVVAVNAGWYVPRRLRRERGSMPVEASAAWVFRIPNAART